ncbi:MAG TPA: metallophosphoesterase [Vicinamibacterales bacterium]|nr:metallophosphoesterase [Vicinamibacterales bacterium]
MTVPTRMARNRRTRLATGARMTPHKAWLLAGALLLTGAGGNAAPQQGNAASRAVVLSDEVMSRLPPDWHAPARHIRGAPIDQQKLLKESQEGLRVKVAQLLAREPAADGFLRAQLSQDPSPRVRASIAEAILADARWMALPDTAAVIESVVASDPDVTVSLAALEGLRRRDVRRLRTLLNNRVAAGTSGRDADSFDRLLEEQERLISLERGTMLPAFLRSPAPSFTVAPLDRPVRVMAFGDFGNGSQAQKNLANTLASYHKSRPFDLAITVGDNFYSVGMKSPSDPRWQTQWEQLYGPLGITFYASLGNHDWGHPDSPAAEILYSAKTTTWRMPSSYYTFSAGPVQFFALDTQSVALSDKQLKWLDTELSRSQARWKVVYGHHPIFSGGNYRDRPDLIAKLLPLLRNRADAYIAGHDHNLQALRPEDGVHFYVAGGGGAGLYDLRVYERSLFSSRTNGFAVIDADAAQLTVSLVNDAGTTLYTDTLKKPATTVSSALEGR